MQVSTKALCNKGIEVLDRPGGTISLPEKTIIEAPSGLKWTKYEHSLSLGAFSYQVSGYCAGANIGRYCSFGEDVQIGRQSHPTTWASTSPAFYLGDRIFDLKDGFTGSSDYHTYSSSPSEAPTKLKLTEIGHDVYIGHGAFISAGVTIGTGAIVAAKSVVAKDVPDYAIVAGNPAVIKGFRLPTSIISPLLKSNWWQFAPWQLSHLDPAKPFAFLQGVRKITEAPFEPDVVDLRTTDLS